VRTISVGPVEVMGTPALIRTISFTVCTRVAGAVVVEKGGGEEEEEDKPLRTEGSRRGGGAITRGLFCGGGADSNPFGSPVSEVEVGVVAVLERVRFGLKALRTAVDDGDTLPCAGLFRGGGDGASIQIVDCPRKNSVGDLALFG